MSGSNRRLINWIVKNEEGLVRGPYSTQEVLEMIENIELTGEEYVARYPGGDWQQISRNPEFYDKLLEALSSNWSTPTQEDTFDENGPSFDSEPSATPIADSSNRESISKTNDDEPFQHFQDTESLQDEADETDFVSKKIDDLELVDTLPTKKKVLKKRIFQSVVVLVAIFILFLLLLPDGPNNRSGGISFVEPQWKGLSSESLTTELSLRLKKAEALIYTDDVANLLKAQNGLVQILSANENVAEAYQFLCLSYFEIWIFTDQGSEQKRIFASVLKKSGQYDFSGLGSTTCRIVDLFFRDRLQEAGMLIDATLDRYASKGVSPPILFYLKAKSLDLKREIQTAIGYLQSAQKLQPAWLRLFTLEAELQYRRKNYSRSQQLLTSVLRINPTHALSQLLLGLVEEKGFRQTEKAEPRLKAGLNSAQFISNDLVSEGYQTLAEIYLGQGKKQEALEYAEKAFKSFSSNIAAKNLLIQLGGKDLTSEARFQSRQLVFEGDQFFREGDYNSAQALYKSAFDIDGSALAALKSGKSLWRLNFPTDAIEWVKKAVKADPAYLEAYILLADYFTARYDFVAAARILSQAQKVAPNSHEIFRGFALVELRRNSPQGAITYAERALKIYGSDIDSYIILARAYLANEDYRNAFAQASKAIEIDANHREGHSVYAKALSGVQGFEVGIDYLYNLVQTYPMISDYRLVLAELLSDNESYLEAEKILRQIIQIEDKPKQAHLLLGQVLSKRGQFDAALDQYFRASLLDPSDAEPLFYAGLTLLQAGKPGEARSQLERVFALNERYPLVNYWLGKSSLAFGQIDDALKFAQAERKTNPNLADSYLLAAEVYTKKEQYSLCTQEYQRAIKLGRQSAQIYVNMAICHRLLGNLELAISMLNQASSQESGYPAIYRELGQVYEKKGDFERASQAYKQYFVLDPNAPDRGLIEQRMGG